MAEVNLDVAMESTSQEILEKMLQGVTANTIRHIQRGTYSGSKEQSITLSGFTNLNKMIVLLNGSAGYEKNMTSLTTTKLTINDNGGLNVEGSYQVIEFY